MTDRQYSAEEIARYRREQRAEQRPPQCTYTSPCWVDDGAPAISQRGACRGCGGRPRSLFPPGRPRK